MPAENRFCTQPGSLGVQGGGLPGLLLSQEQRSLPRVLTRWPGRAGPRQSAGTGEGFARSRVRAHTHTHTPTRVHTLLSPCTSLVAVLASESEAKPRSSGVLSSLGAGVPAFSCYGVGQASAIPAAPSRWRQHPGQVSPSPSPLPSLRPLWSLSHQATAATCRLGPQGRRDRRWRAGVRTAPCHRGQDRFAGGTRGSSDPRGRRGPEPGRPFCSSAESRGRNASLASFQGKGEALLAPAPNVFPCEPQMWTTATRLPHWPWPTTLGRPQGHRPPATPHR